MKTTLTAALAGVIGAGTLLSTAAQAQSYAPAVYRGDAALIDAQYRRGCFRGERPRECRDRLRWERRQNRQLRWDNGRYYYDDNRGDQAGAAIIGGILGFALGAAIAGNDDDRRYWDSRRGDRRYVAECRRRYRSFDYNSGTYLDRDGYRRYCRY